MATIKEWQWDEVQQIGKDYAALKEVEIYDETHNKFRDTLSESKDVILKLGASKGETLLDIGCGTGVFLIQAAKFGLSVFGVDVSEKMLEYAAKKSKENSVDIELKNSGFLILPYENEKFDYVTTSFSMHHLPDFYKFIALKNMHRVLKKNGVLFIQDVVIVEKNYEDNINALIKRQYSLGGNFLKEDAIQHFKEEFSTFDWILDQMIEKAGFKIMDKNIDDGLFAKYYCTK